MEMVLDKAGQKGTGKWTSQAALDLGVPIPTIDSAVSMRQISAQKDVRLLIAQKFGSEMPVVQQQIKHGDTVTSELVEDSKATRAEDDLSTTVSEHHAALIGEQAKIHLSQTVENPEDEQKNLEVVKQSAEDFDRFVEELKNAMLASFIVTYAQGMSLLQAASIEKNYGLNLSEIAKIWRGGCIIRSALLDEMRRAYGENQNLPNLILDNEFANLLNKNRADWRTTVDKFTDSRVPVLCLSSALAYFDAFRSEVLPANLIQAQRDFFGAHTYQRVDKEGVFHTPDWNK